MDYDEYEIYDADDYQPTKKPAEFRNITVDKGSDVLLKCSAERGDGNVCKNVQIF